MRPNTSRATRRWIRPLAGLVIAGLVAAACGGDDSGDATPTPTPADAASGATDDDSSDTTAAPATAAPTTASASSSDDTPADTGFTGTIRVIYVSPDFLGVPIEEDLAILREQVPFEIETRQVNGWYGDLAQAVQREIAAGDVSDVAMMGLSNLRQFVEADRVTPITELFAAEGPDFAAQYDPAFLELMSFDGELYGMGWAYSNAVMYYNKDIFAAAGLDPEAPPETWSEVVEAARTIRAELGDDIIPITYPTGGDNWMFQTNLASNGGSIMNADETEFVFNDDAAVATVDFWRNLVEEGLMPVEGYDDMSERFFAGQQAMILHTIGAFGRVDSNVGDRFEWGTGLFPIPDDGQRQLAVGGSGFSILTDDPERIEAAWTILKHLAGPEAQANQAVQLGYMATNLLPPQTSSGELSWGMLEYLEEEPRRQVAYRQAADSIPWYSAPRNNVEIDQIIVDAVDAALRGTGETQQILDDAVARANALR